MKYVFNGPLRFEEYFDSHLKVAHGRRFILRTVVVLVGVLAILNQPDLSPGALLSNWRFFFAFALIVYGLVLSPLQFKYQVKFNWNRYPALHEHRQLIFDRVGMTAVDDAGSPVLTKWDKFIKWKETRSSFMLFLSPRLWITVPKRLLARENIPEFRTFLVAKLDVGRRAADV